jgi:hypothetical protein
MRVVQVRCLLHAGLAGESASQIIEISNLVPSVLSEGNGWHRARMKGIGVMLLGRNPVSGCLPVEGDHRPVYGFV